MLELSFTLYNYGCTKLLAIIDSRENNVKTNGPKQTFSKICNHVIGKTKFQSINDLLEKKVEDLFIPQEKDSKTGHVFDGPLCN